MDVTVAEGFERLWPARSFCGYLVYGARSPFGDGMEWSLQLYDG